MKRNSNILAIHKSVDLILTAAAFIGAYYVKRHFLFIVPPGMSIVPNYYFLLLLVLVVFSFCFRITGLYEYRTAAEIFYKFLPRLVFSVVLGVSIVTLVMYLLKEQHVSRIMIGLFVIFDVIFLTANKYFFTFFVVGQRRGAATARHLVIVGKISRASQLIRALQNGSGHKYSIVGCLIIRKELVGQEVSAGVKAIGTLDDFRDVLVRNTVDEVVFTSPDFLVDSTRDCISFAEKIGVTIHILLDWQLEKLMYQPEIAIVQFDSFLGLPTVRISSAPKNDVEQLVKSFMDYVGAALALLLLSPFLAIIAILIKVDSKGRIIFGQERCGYNGRKFRLLKFRTMVENAEELLPQVQGRNEVDGPVFKIANDPRITTVGRLLRKSSLDELPQLVNILRGEMSLVGPRPPLPSEVEKYEPWQRRRLSMKPGLTCIWQVYGRNSVAFDEWMRMDLDYIDNWSILLDAKLILLTVNAILKGTGK